ncbi:putative Inactive homolog of metal-dependent proteases, molecular chaperone [Rhodovastum atsumiense]|uniref:tRNA (Adenosine(37)-N6)-threonylcarbamoyltransferase complex dimerization subunit type 1 TsaB n=1 Tax=Rhodovastum atsumiense TaxID=504468 RepID=A0A5M6IKU4_9PROT|nr:tRNA (adenosine(37)-N6)-threonylcarbamoyltransferase complex dimerization subunit type 1 TsaB [Rhodovastum atsumiense]KAA5608802.1 tRNA (adenosine(37)-N6)-threonylcarbamoyltransferase complex dimerization subunit type 1 TsaB [Rhodovastum atsumiense]CAH2600864.1 putative Inactive homolog of metal-dependent proteases, molecular chaperone [Rhodovastum atsumiense]
MLILGLDAALARCSVAVLADGVLRAERCEDGGRGHAGRLPAMTAAVLAESRIAATALDAVAVTVGPGSFTGLRAALALAHGLALAIDRPVIGVTTAEALAAAVTAAERDGRSLWVAIDSRRGRVFLDRLTDAEGARAFSPETLPHPAGALALAGDAAEAVAARLAAAGVDARATAVRLPRAREVAAVGGRRLAGDLPPLAAWPLYVDPPEAKLPEGGLRPPPAAE